MQPTLALTLTADKLLQAFCWMLVHSLWIGLLATLLTGLVMMATVRSRPALRYNLVAGLLAFFLVACGASFLVELSATGVPRDRLALTGAGPAEAYGLKPFLQAFLDFYASHTSWILGGWALLFCRKAAQLTGAMAYNHRLRQDKLPVTDGHWKERFRQLTAKLGIRGEVAFFESGLISIPVVIGHLKPVVFVPLGVLTHLSPAEVEAVLLHELAHIKRRDYLVNLCQLVAEAVFAFNPALLWMSAILREEREACCDDMAIAATRSKKGFIQALVSFGEGAAATTRYTLAFPAAKNSLLKRVCRIVQDRNTPLDAAGKTFALASLFLLGILVTAATDTIVLASPEATAKVMAIPLPAGPAPVAAVAPSPKTSKATGVVKKSLKPRRVKIRMIPPAKDNHTTPGIVRPVSLPSSSVTPATALVKQRPVDHTGRLRVQVETDRQQADRDRAQAILDRQQAQKDREQAARDREQALRDREQAIKDRQQAQKDRAQAELDRNRMAKERSTQIYRTSIEL
jgi:beta-lactamase regulating signal transducer with metallopeptidase domain